MIKHTMLSSVGSALAGLLLATCGVAVGQAPVPAAPVTTPATENAPAAGAAGLDSLSWLAGCWLGAVNGREFREQWMPLRGDLMLGIGQTVFKGKTQNFEYLRLEPRADGVYYVALPGDQREAAFRLVSTTVDDLDTIFTFANAGHDFPQRIIYRRGTKGWLYATIEGKQKGEDQRVIYPMQRIDCGSGDLIRE